MFKNISETLKDYGVIAGVVSVATIAIRPFISIKQTIRDMVITFCVSYFSGMILEYTDFDKHVICGICGILGLLAVRIYMVLESILKQIQKNPIKTIKELRGKDE